MSLYREYLEEVGGRGIVEREHGFAIYRIYGKECYIEDIYVRQDYRKTYLASEMAHEIEKHARAFGCTYISGTVDPCTPGWESRKEVLMRYGFKVFKEEPKIIVFAKEL